MKFLVLFCTGLLFLSSTPAQAEVVSIPDKLHGQVELSLPVQRAIFLQMQEFLPVMDIWDRVAGLSVWGYRSDLLQATYADLHAIPSAGSGSDLNIEALLRLQPDLVLTWAIRPEMVQFMQAKGLPVLTVYPESIPELYEVMEILGRLFQREENLAKVQGKMEAIFSLIRQRAEQIPHNKRKRILHIGGRANSVACAIGINNDLIEMIGGINPAASIQENNALVSLEQIVMWNPEVIFIWGSAGYGVEDILNNPQWRNIQAVRSKQVYKLPRWSTWSPRLALVALTMATAAYPELYEDLKLREQVDQFYQSLFNIPYTGEDIL